MEFEDRPKPGKGFVIFIVIVMAGSFLMVIMPLFTHGPGNPKALTATVLGVFILALVGWVVKSSAFRPRYIVSNNMLELRNGITYKKIRLSRIMAIEHAESWRDLIFPFWRRQGFCNRFKDLVRLELKGDTVFVSPSNPALFVEVIRKLIAETNPVELKPDRRAQ